MSLIRIQERPGGPNGSNAVLSFDNGPEYPITISDPFTQEEETELEWYFEEYLAFPFIRKVRAQDAAASITTYGEALFKQVFGDPDIYAEYRSLLKSGLAGLHIEIAGSPQFHALHWESLQDPKLLQPLTLQITMVRKNLQPQAVPASVRPSSTINLLIVVARPSGARDVGYRTISRPLVEALRNANLRVQVDILCPGTYKALENHLRDVTAKHGEGYYHVIHFDLHGAVLTYEQFQRIQQQPKATPYQYKRYARQDIQPYQGVKAFLSFEPDADEQEHKQKTDLVEASEMASLLTKHHVPITILNACQSGKQIGTSETSLGSHLIQSGVQLVLAMGYSVTVSAAELLMSTLYQHLFAGDDLAVAIRHARMELYNNKERRAYFDQQIDLEDWLLPVVHQNQPVTLQPREFTPEERAAWLERKVAEKQYTPPDPQYGFVGRDIDILQIERRLLTRRNILLVRGMGGAGKTTLLRHLASWWHTTGFVQRVFSFGYDEEAWTLQQIMTDIAQTLYGPKCYTDFQPLPLAAQQAMLTQDLRANNHLLILDNLESITGAQLAIQHTLPPDEQAALHSFLTDLARGRTLVLLGSRGGEDWLARDTFADNVYDLRGLDPEATSTLADRILARHDATQYRQDPDLQHLLKLLAGFPLALEVVLANLAHQTPTEVLAALQAGDVTLNPGDSQEKTENILRCIDYSHSNLSPESQQLLLCLAPFTSVIRQDMLTLYTTHLRQQPALASLPFECWPQVLREASNWGLLSPDPDTPVYLHVQPTLPYFLRNRLHTPEQAELRTAVETAFREHYDQLGASLYHLLESKDPKERQMGQLLTGLEYENLLTALRLALAAQVSILKPYLILSVYLDATQDQQHGLELGQAVLDRLEAYPSEKLAGPLGAEFAGIVDNIAKQQLQLRDFVTAEASYNKALKLFSQVEGINENVLSKLKAAIYHNLGFIAREQRRWDQAMDYYQQVLDIYTDLDDHHGKAPIYGELGTIAKEQHQWRQAKDYYMQALQIFVDFNDLVGQAPIYHNLGNIAEEQYQWNQAMHYYQQSLEIYSAFNDRHNQAKTYHHLGTLHQRQRQLSQAEYYYQQALQIAIDIKDRHLQGSIYGQLGTLAYDQDQPDQAEQYSQQALHIYIDFDDRYKQARTYNNLGLVAQQQRQWSQAREYFLKALERFMSYKDEHCIDIALQNLAWLWQTSGDADLPTAIASIIGTTPGKVEALLRKMLEDEDAEADGS